MLAEPRERELLYRLLQSRHAALLRRIVQDESEIAQVRRGIDWLRQHYDKPVPIGALAEIAGMSVASFNRHFRAATAASPLQYRKMLRLQTARQLLERNADVADGLCGRL